MDNALEETILKHFQQLDIASQHRLLAILQAALDQPTSPTSAWLTETIAFNQKIREKYGDRAETTGDLLATLREEASWLPSERK